MRYAVAFLLLASTALAQEKPKKEGPLDLAQMALDEMDRRVKHAQAMREGRLSGNSIPSHDLFESQEKERAKAFGKRFEGYVTVLKVDKISGHLAGQYVLGRVEGCPVAVARCNAAESDDPIFRDLKAGDRVLVKGYVAKAIDQFEQCEFAVMNLPTKTTKAKAKAKPKAEAKVVSDEDRAAGILKVANALYADGNGALGRNRLEMLIRDFPKTKAAGEARKTLGQ